MDTEHSLLEILDRLPGHWEPTIKRFELRNKSYSPVQALSILLTAIRDMPYGRPSGDKRGAEDCLRDWRGTCSSKHLVAFEALEAFGLKPVMWLASYQINFAERYFPAWLREWADSTQVFDVHNYLTCEIFGRNIIVDVTFPKSFGKCGFPVTDSWNVGQNFVLCCTPERCIRLKPGDSIVEIKRRWLEDLNTPESLRLRELAISAITELAGRLEYERSAEAN